MGFTYRSQALSIQYALGTEGTVGAGGATAARLAEDQCSAAPHPSESGQTAVAQAAQSPAVST